MVEDSSLGGGAELIRSIAKSPGRDVLTDARDISIDQVLESDIAKDIPVVGWVAKLAGVAVTVRDRMFAK